MPCEYYPEDCNAIESKILKEDYIKDICETSKNLHKGCPIYMLRKQLEELRKENPQIRTR